MVGDVSFNGTVTKTGDYEIDGDTLYKLKYTYQVVKETLRYRPAAPMVPQVRQKCIIQK